MEHTSRQRSCGDELAGRLRWHVHHCLRRGDDCSIVMFCPVARAEGACPAPDAARALAYLAERLSPIIRRTDAIEIDGGQALAIVLSGAGRDGVRAVYQRMRDLLAPRPLPGDTPFVLGISYATGAEEWANECALDAALRDACIPRSLVTLGLPVDYRERRWLGPTAPAAPRWADGVAAHLDTLATPAAGRKTPARRGARHLRLVPPVSSSGHPRRVNEALRERARALGVPYVQMPESVPSACREMLSPELARELGAVPIGRSRTTLTVAMRNPQDARAMLRLRAATGLAIFPVLAAPDELDRALLELDAVAEG